MFLGGWLRVFSLCMSMEISVLITFLMSVLLYFFLFSSLLFPGAEITASSPQQVAVANLFSL